MIDINLDRVEKSFGFVNVIDDISFDVNNKDKIALVGSNGCGKSTILKMIIGLEETTKGNINIRRGLKIKYLSQNLDEYKDIKVIDLLYKEFSYIFDIKNKLDKLESDMLSGVNLDKTMDKYYKVQQEFIELDGYRIEDKINSIIKEFSLEDIKDKNIDTLSCGQKTRAVLASKVIDKCDLLLLDEPTNHLDIDTLEWLEDYLSSFDGSIVMISHDRYFINKIVNKVILLEYGKAYLFYGNYDAYLINNDLRIEKLNKEATIRQREIKRLETSAKKLREFGRLGGNEIFYKRAKSIEHKIEKMEVINKHKELNQIPINFDMNSRTGEDVLFIKDYSFGYDDLLFDNISLELKYQDRLCIIGSNGSGKSTLIKKIVNNEFELGSRVKVGYIPQVIEFEDEHLTVIDIARNHFNGAEHHLRSALTRFLFTSENQFKRIDKLSGGERVRLKLFLLMQDKTNLLILDEITNHIDIETKEVLESALNSFDGTILFISHDRYFINNIATRIGAIENKIINYYPGNYDDYLNFKKNK